MKRMGLPQEDLFQFPSNGKVEPKWTTSYIVRAGPICKVSIPFKRESGAKEDTLSDESAHSRNEFQFPSNGKVEPKASSESLIWQCFKGFNSLQTGKWSQRPDTHVPCTPGRLRVSIPFKRESGAKVRMHASVTVQNSVSIPFKRESGAKVGCITRLEE